MTKFKVLLYTEFASTLKESGLGKAILHQETALKHHGIPYTFDIHDDFDIAHINFYGPRSYFLAKKCKKTGKKVVYHAHSTEEDFKNSFILSNFISPLFKKWLIKCYSQSDLIITPTPYSKKLLEGYGLKKVHTLSNGIDTSFFVKNPDSARRFREVYSFRPEDKVILGIGLYLERKGILDFIKLAHHFPEYKFIWFGHTNPNIIPKKIRDAINSAPKNIQFPGHVNKEMVLAGLSGCNLYLFPTHEETEGIPALEACSVGAPTLVRDIPVFHPWLEDGKNIYMAKDYDDFVEKIPQIIEGKLPDLSREARKVAESRDIEKIGIKLIKLYETVL